MAISFACVCGSKFRVNEELAGKKSTCPKCRRVVVVPGDAAPPSPGYPQKPPANPEGAGKISATSGRGKACPSCGADLPAEAVLCVGCGFDFRTGGKLSPPAATVKIEPASIEPAGSSRQPRSSSRWIWLAGTGAMLLLTAGVAAYFFLWRSPEVYRFQPKQGACGPADNIAIEGGPVKKDGQWVKYKTLEGGGMTVVFNFNADASPFLPPGPGSTKLHVFVNKEVGYTTEAGLRFRDDTVFNIWPDGVVEADREGVRAEDANGRSYVSREVRVGDKKAIVMVKK